MTTLHVHPQDDALLHDTSTDQADCICGPTVQPQKDEDGAMTWLIIHHSLDGREKQEGQRQ